MRYMHAVILLLTTTLMSCLAVAQPDMSLGEQLFVSGTNHFRATGSDRNPVKGLEELIASAQNGYNDAPYGLCIALSSEPEIINLTESYAWCNLAAHRNNQFAQSADSRATEVLGRIAVNQGMEEVSAAKKRAAELEKQFSVKTVSPDASASPQSGVPNTTQQNKDLNEEQNFSLLQAYSSILRELLPIFDPGNDIKAKIEHLDSFEFQDETKKKLFEQFGNENPLHITVKKVSNGNTNISFVLDSLNYQDAKTGTKVRSTELIGNGTFNKLFTKEHAIESMSSISYDNGKTLQLSANDFSYITDQNLGAFGLWLGTYMVKLGHWAIDINPLVHLKFDGLYSKAVSKNHGKLVDVDFDTSVKTINWGIDSLGPVHIAIRVSNIDGKALAIAGDSLEKVDRENLSKEKRLAADIGILKEFGQLLLKPGAAIEFKDISAKYHGITAGLNGRVSLNNAQSSDLESIKLIGEKVIAHFNVHVPMAFVREFSRTYSRNALEQQNIKNKLLNQPTQPVTDDAVNAMAKTMVEKFTENLLKEKLFQIKHDIILSTIEIKQGKLKINGKDIPIPATK